MADTNSSNDLRYINRYESTTGWAGATVHDPSNPACCASGPALAVNERGNAVLAWQRMDFDCSRVLSRYFVSGR